MGRYMNTTFSAKVRIVWIISTQDTSQLKWCCLCSSHWFEVGRAPLKHSDVAHLSAPIGIWQYLNQNVMAVEALSVYVSGLLQVQFDHRTHRVQMNKISYVFKS